MKNINNYSKENKIYINKEKTTLMTGEGFRENLVAIKESFFEATNRKPKYKLPEVKPNMNVFSENNDKIKFIWLGHSSLIFNIDGKIILIDPVFSDYASPINLGVKRFQKAVIGLDELPNVDTILISHNHYDHLDKKTVLHFKNKNTKFLVPLGVKNILTKWGIDSKNIEELNWYDKFESNGITYSATPARHFSGRGLFDRNKTLWVSWVIEANNERIFFSGDSGYGNHYKEIYNHFGSFDIAFLENGQYDKRWKDIHMLPEETVQAAQDLKAKTFVPIHWGMFDLSLHKWYEPVENSYEIAKQNSMAIIVPKLGEVFYKDSHKNDSFWLHEYK